MAVSIKGVEIVLHGTKSQKTSLIDTTCTYPEPDQSSPQHSILSLKGQSKCYLSTHVSVNVSSSVFKILNYHDLLLHHSVIQRHTVVSFIPEVEI
jgi:hypothetical protein